MEHAQLIEFLKATANNLKEEKLPQIDFQQLGDCLTEAVDLIEAKSCELKMAARLIKLFKEELICKARAAAQVSGKCSDLVERMINNPQLSLEELLKLKQEIENEFDAAFSHNLSEPTGAAGKGEKMAEFKI